MTTTQPALRAAPRPRVPVTTALAGAVVSGVLAVAGLWSAAWLVTLAALAATTLLSRTAPVATGGYGATGSHVTTAEGPVADAAGIRTAERAGAAPAPHDDRTDGALRTHLAEGVDGLTGLDRELEHFTAAVQAAASGLNLVRSTTFQVLGQISELGAMSDQISSMVDAIRRIASQTNLLSLNATIEAARAGEAGRGFAVVAGEVRKLAQDSREATESIDAIVTEVRETTEITIEVANGASEQVEDTKTQFEGLEQSITSCAAQLHEVLRQVGAAQEVVQQLSSSTTRR